MPAPVATKGEEKTNGDGSNRFALRVGIARTSEAVEQEILRVVDREPGQKENQNTIIIGVMKKTDNNMGGKAGGTGKVGAIGGK